MKTLLLIVCLFCFCGIYAQETSKVLYAEGNCSSARSDTEDEEQTTTLSFKLENGSLYISGKIVANCCGEHYLEAEIYADSIFLARVDEGELCKCRCLHDINVEIKNCPSDFYKIKLEEYVNDGIETTVYSDAAGLNNLIGQDVKCYPNPAKDHVIVELSNRKVEKIVLYDSFGKTVKEIQGIATDKLVINTEQLMSGTYLIRFFEADGTAFTKKIVVLK